VNILNVRIVERPMEITIYCQILINFVFVLRLQQHSFNNLIRQPNTGGVCWLAKLSDVRI